MDRFVVRMTDKEVRKDDYAGISGLTLIKHAVDAKHQSQLLEFVNSGTWIGKGDKGGINRRTQQYGYRHDYQSKTIHQDVDPLPSWSLELCKYLLEKKWISELPNQLIINEYQEGQGIAAHSDSKTFGPCIFSVSLGSPCTMTFRHHSDSHAVVLHPGTFLKMERDARYKWTHEIAARKKSDGVRVSLTFRRV